MQTVLTPEYKTGIFRQELKNRFLCEVDIDGKSTVCYVPSSCHLGNFLDLSGKKVLLVPTKGEKTRTEYALFAVPYKRKHILLNTSFANRVIIEKIHTRSFSSLGPRKVVFKEHVINGYKADLFIADTNTVIEVKSVISIDDTGCFPTIYSERAINQLDKVIDLLQVGYKAHYIIVALNPYTKSIKITKDTLFRPSFDACIKLGMQISAFALEDNKSNIKLKRIEVLEE